MEFKKNVSENENMQNGADWSKLNGNLSDFDKGLNLAKNEKWYEALKTFSKLLSLPDEIDKATEYLLKIMQEKEPVKLDVINMAHDLSTETVTGEIKVDLGGGIVPRLIELRGRCFIEVFEIVTQLMKSGKDISREFFSSSQEANQFMKQAIVHAAVSMQIFWNKKFIIAFAGGIFFRSGNLEHAIACMERVLELDPGYEYAAKVLSWAKQQLSEEAK